MKENPCVITVNNNLELGMTQSSPIIVILMNSIKNMKLTLKYAEHVAYRLFMML